MAMMMEGDTLLYTLETKFYEQKNYKLICMIMPITKKYRTKYEEADLVKTCKKIDYMLHSIFESKQFEKILRQVFEFLRLKIFR